MCHNNPPQLQSAAAAVESLPVNYLKAGLEKGRNRSLHSLWHSRNCRADAFALSSLLCPGMSAVAQQVDREVHKINPPLHSLRDPSSKLPSSFLYTQYK